MLLLLIHATLQNPSDISIDQTRAVVIRCLMNYLGEKEEELFQEYNVSILNITECLLYL